MDKGCTNIWLHLFSTEFLLLHFVNEKIKIGIGFMEKKLPISIKILNAHATWPSKKRTPAEKNPQENPPLIKESLKKKKK